MTRRALITGITGQDGYYLARRLLDEGVDVFGMIRPGQAPNLERLAPLAKRLSLVEGDLTDQAALVKLVDDVRPGEIYNLAGISFVPESWPRHVEAVDVMGLGVGRLLEAIRQVDSAIRFCQAGSSEQFGAVDCEPQNEDTQFRPRAPYGAAKALAHWLVAQFRARYGLFACTAIQYNHESPLRNKRFVTRKITDAAARIKLGRQERLTLGNLDGRRDWGYADDYVRAMQLVLRRDRPDDFVVATGKTHTVRELVEWSFARVDLDWQDYVSFDPELLRPEDTHTLRGDATKARRELGWEPSVELEQLIAMMVDADLERVQAEIDAEAE